GLYVSEDGGGTGLSRLDATLVFEALSMACPSVAAFLSIHNMCAKMIDSFGSDEMKARVMPDVLAMNTVLSYCLTEPGSGSDAAALKTRAERTNEGYTLNGTKSFISGGGYSDAYVCMVRTGEGGAAGVSTVYVEDGSDGLSFGGLEQKMGWRSQPTAQVQFDDCKVAAQNLIGEEGKGFKYAMMGLDGGRLNISACSLGAAQTALNATLDYMGERKAFGKSIDQFQGLQWRLADMEIELQAARVFLRQAAWKLDTGAQDATKYCAMAKKFVTEVGSKVVDQCLQLHGGYGYLADYGIEKLVRDLRVHQILEGTNEIMRVIVARDMLKNR
ncbi:acyl-CoA dehydrogenase family protein, partial [Ascidiaceihabitans sp.]|nr:acyl-CoA dehydrogenase family protein [Ascidiaceihabitans sp.]